MKMEKFQSFNLAKFQCIKDSRKYISCFPIDIDPMSKLFKNLLKEYSGLFGPRLFRNFKNIDFRMCDISRNNIFRNWPGTFLELFEVSWCFRSRNNWFGGVMVTSAKPEKHENDSFSGFSNNESWKLLLLFRNEAE